MLDSLKCFLYCVTQQRVRYPNLDCVSEKNTQKSYIMACDVDTCVRRASQMCLGLERVYSRQQALIHAGLSTPLIGGRLQREDGHP